MDIDIILEPDVTPQQVAELAVEAEKQGVRALWSSNYHQNWDPFISLAPAAMATSKLVLGPLAVSPWEMHPLKMANAILTLNEIASGRAMIAISGGGGALSACGWKISPDAPVWPIKDNIKGNRYPERRVRGVREAIEILKLASSGEMFMPYEGGTFQTTRPAQMSWAQSAGPLIYGACSGPMMVRMGARIADGIQLSDFTVEMIPDAMENVQAGLAKRDGPAENFRVGNFWAFHIKEDRHTAMYEARRELIWRGAIAAKYEHEIRPFCHDDQEVEVVIDNYMNFMKAFWTRSGEIEGVPSDLVNRLIAGMSSTGDMTDLEQEIERFRQFKASGLTELSLRLFDDPMDGLKIIGEHVVPAVKD
jgi:alkanesulfonate monooxygenase SsuD/methylene tetrahydromethanopterin reductase-like flavin-dependent oxidoreductase (luciferase family)